MRKRINLSLLISMIVFVLLASGCSRARTETNERTRIIPPADSAIGAPTSISVQEVLATPIVATATPINALDTAPLIPATATPISIITPNASASTSGTEIVSPTATPLNAATVGQNSSASSSGGEVIHIVQAGENLFRIGLKYNVAPETIAAYNGISDVTLIYIGQKLRIPTASGGNFINGDTYIVQNGDSLLSIAVAFGTTTEALISANNLSNPDVLYVGQVLKVP